MKRLVLFLILLFSANILINSEYYWIRVPSPTTYTLNKFIFTDTLNGWAVGDSGVIIHTSNGGNNWVVQNSSLDLHFTIYDVFFLNPRLGWCIANDDFYYNRYIIKTTDGGNSWNRYMYLDSIPNCIYFTDSLTGFIGEVYGSIYKTTDGGLNWAKSNFSSSFFNYRSRVAFKFLNPQIGVVCGGNHDAAGLIYNTTNSGWEWNIRDSATGETVNDIVYLDPLNVIASGGDFEFGVIFLKSTDGGFTWRDQFLPFLGVGRSMAPRTRGEYWIPLYAAQKWALSLDSGTTWQEIQVVDSQSLNFTKFIDSYHGWTVGSNGAIYKFNTAAIGITPIANSLPTEFRLYQNYPNPFNPTTTIMFETPMSSMVKIYVYDITGKLISKIVDHYLNAGYHRLTWDGSNLASGVYFYRFEAGSYVESKKMILLK